jgi:NAD(P)-dependent dehydrogenase (short-subunit alcohol dehydrogenase family)
VRRALVTGGARGIGAAVAARLRADGLSVAVLDVLAEGADFVVDLSDADGALPDLGDVDVVVSCAAITTTVAAGHRMTDEQWRRDLEVNLTGAYRVVRACLPGMRSRGYGRVVVVSSLAAAQGLPGQVAYAASKAGLIGMVRTLAAENAAHGVSVNAILPGMVETEMVRAMPAAVLEQVMARLPSGRMVSMEEVAALVGFLCGEAAGQVTGQDIAIAGGMELNTHSLTASGDR